jgi:hypothetical protein
MFLLFSIIALLMGSYKWALIWVVLYLVFK